WTRFARGRPTRVKKGDLEPTVVSRTTVKFMIIDPIVGSAYGVNEPERCWTHSVARPNHRHERYSARPAGCQHYRCAVFWLPHEPTANRSPDLDCVAVL